MSELKKCFEKLDKACDTYHKLTTDVAKQAVNEKIEQIKADIRTELDKKK